MESSERSWIAQQALAEGRKHFPNADSIEVVWYSPNPDEPPAVKAKMKDGRTKALDITNRLGQNYIWY